MKTGKTIISINGCIHTTNNINFCGLPCTEGTPHGWLCEYHDRKLHPLRTTQSESEEIN